MYMYLSTSLAHSYDYIPRLILCSMEGLSDVPPNIVDQIIQELHRLVQPHPPLPPTLQIHVCIQNYMCSMSYLC